MREYEVLQALTDLGPRSQQELATLLRVNRTLMVKLIDELEQAALVARRRNPTDRRSYALELTAAGSQARGAMAHAADRADSGLTALLSRPQRGRLSRRLAAIARAGKQEVTWPDGLADRVSFLVMLAYFEVRVRVDERLHALDLTTALYGNLATIEAHGPLSQQALAAGLGLTGPAILQVVDRLEARGLVERRRDPADRRSYGLVPTEQGRATLDRARDAIAQLSGELDALLGGANERAELGRLLHKLVASG
jgi:DNA-binding MarR family transcriptional regulator